MNVPVSRLDGIRLIAENEGYFPALAVPTGNHNATLPAGLFLTDLRSSRKSDQATRRQRATRDDPDDPWRESMLRRIIRVELFPRHFTR